MRVRRAVLIVFLAACAGTELRLDPSPSCGYREAATLPPDAGAEGAPMRPASSIVAGQRHACSRLGLTDDVVCWGANDLQQITHALERVPLEGLKFDRWRDLHGIVAGGAHTCARTNAGVECWGNNARGQLGLGHREPMPGVETAALTFGADFVAAGLLHTCALLPDSPVPLCWGDNTFGQLGVSGEPDCCASATPVEGLPSGTIRGIAAGALHTCAVIDQELWCWGDDRFGALGDGEAGGSRAEPIRVDLGERVINGLALGAHHTCALAYVPADRFEQEMWCWGRGDRGQLGDGTMATRATPARVAIEHVRDFALGGDVGLAFVGGTLTFGEGAGHTCARTNRGEVWCWGANDRGQLGDGTREDRSVPTLALWPGTTWPERLAVGGAFTCVNGADGTVWCWGANDHGQLGFEGPDALEPVRVPVIQ